MTNVTTKPNSLQPAADKAVDLFDNWFDPIEMRFGLDRVNLLKSCFAASWTLRWQGRVTNEARWPAMKEEPKLRATATAAARDR